MFRSITLIFAGLAVFVSQANAKDLWLECTGKYNSEKILDTKVKLAHEQRGLNMGGSEPFQFFLSSNGKNIVELQAYNNWEISRSYATATMDTLFSFVEISVWKNEYLMEARCTLVSE